MAVVHVKWTPEEWRLLIPEAARLLKAEVTTSKPFALGIASTNLLPPDRQRSVRSLNSAEMEAELDAEILRLAKGGKPRVAIPPAPEPENTGHKTKVWWTDEEELTVATEATRLVRAEHLGRIAALQAAQINVLPPERNKAIRQQKNAPRVFELIDEMLLHPAPVPPAPPAVAAASPAVSPPPPASPPAPAPDISAALGQRIGGVLLELLTQAMESERGQLALASAIELAFAGRQPPAPPAQPPKPEGPPPGTPISQFGPCPPTPANHWPEIPKRHNPEPAPTHGRAPKLKVCLYGLIAGQPAWAKEHYSHVLDLQFIYPENDGSRIADVAGRCEVSVVAMAMVRGPHLKILRQQSRRHIQVHGTMTDLRNALDALAKESQARSPVPLAEAA
jgi:hypothetical protein